MASVVAVSRRTGASAARETRSPSAAATPIPPAAMRMRKIVMRCSVRFTSVRGRKMSTAYPEPSEPMAGNVSTRYSASSTRLSVR